MPVKTGGCLMKTIFGTVLLLGLIAAGGCSGDADRNAEGEVTVEDLMKVLQISYFERVLPATIDSEDRVYLAYRYPDGSIKQSAGISNLLPGARLRIFVRAQDDNSYVVIMSSPGSQVKIPLTEPFAGYAPGPKFGPVEDFLVRFTTGQSVSSGGPLSEDNFDLFLLLERSTPGEADRAE
jgi:hypothetical protein